MVLFYPFPQLVVAIFITYLSMAAKRINLRPVFKKIAGSLPALIILPPLLIFDIKILVSYHSFLQRTGGTSFWSPVLYEIVDYVTANKLTGYRIVCLEGEFYDSVQFITKGELNFDFSLLDCPASEKQEVFLDRLKVIFNQNKRSYFIIPVFDNSSKQAIVNLGKDVSLEKIFYNKVKEPQYYLYKVE
jgi:hypothetical protein